MPDKTHEHKSHHKDNSSQGGFISNSFRRTMNKNEKIIMGILVGGIVLFLALSILVLFRNTGKDKTQDLKNRQTGTTGEEKITHYPTIPPVKDMTVMINSRRFNPASASIPRGGFVDFLNIDSVSITIEGNDANSTVLNIGEIEPSNDKQVTFNTPGTYTYRNKAKPTQVGVIIVK